MRSQRAQGDALRLLALSAMAAAAVLLQTACLRAALLNHLNSLNWGSAGGIECPQSGNCSISTQGSTTGAYGSGTSWTVSTNLQVSDSSIIHTGTSTAQASIGSPDDLSIPFYVETNSGYVSLAKHFDVEQPLIYRVSGNLQDESSVVLYQYPFGFNFAPFRYKVWPGESPLPFAKSGVLYPGRYQYQLNAAAHAAAQTVPYQPSDSAQMSFNVNLTFEPAKAVVSGIGALGVRRKTGETIALPEGEDTYLGSGDTIFTQGDSRAYVVLSDGYHQLKPR